MHRSRSDDFLAESTEARRTATSLPGRRGLALRFPGSHVYGCRHCLDIELGKPSGAPSRQVRVLFAHSLSGPWLVASPKSGLAFSQAEGDAFVEGNMLAP